ncbi:MAG: hypothetical protein IPP58_10985 [Holophagaceae bacterium]|uniref:Uncharacterized protein n=1 Tax=Candidatus Geothrix skivensis TaxID=2954439 RepID=A0A9D7SHI4_9BACT|nr:hypothetical protein [Candidatus Geothrix skivensis]
MPRRILFVSSLALSLIASSQAQEDPVQRARTQRASALGIAEGDLPPVPRGIVEPPPLPPPEAHVKDSRKSRRAKAKKGKTGSRKAKGVATKAPAKGKVR